MRAIPAFLSITVRNRVSSAINMAGETLLIAVACLYFSTSVVETNGITDFLNPTKSAFACTWPTKQPTQLRCDYKNCGSIRIQRIIASRLEGNMTDCLALNRSPLTRNVVSSCNYYLMEDHPFFRILQVNCTNRDACQFDPFNELFRDGGICGNGPNTETDVRNWVHVKYQCFGDGSPCEPLFEETTEPPTIPPTIPSTMLPTTTIPPFLDINSSTSTGRVLLDLSVSETEETLEKPSDPMKGVKVANIIIPILMAMLSVVILLVVVCILYRSKACKKKPGKQQLNKSDQTSITIRNGNINRSFKIDADRLHELQYHISHSDDKKSTEEITSTNEPSPNKIKLLHRRSHHSSGSTSPSLDQPHDRYLSDSSTTDAEQFQRRHHWVKPFPPLPKPEIKHSEIYFTETETENESFQSKAQPEMVELAKEDAYSSTSAPI